MEVPIQVAVRLRPAEDNSVSWLTTDHISHSVVLNNGEVYKVDYAPPLGCTQHQLYSSILPVQINSILDGCDTSIVVFGQENTGKTYSLLGSNFNFSLDDTNLGIIPRFILDIFKRFGETPERSYTAHATWMKLINGTVIDLFGCGLAKCSNINEALQLLRKGASQLNGDPCHTVFTVTIEQRWIGVGGVLHHKLSTASFCELAAFPEPSLECLEDVISNLLQLSNNKVVSYQQSLLTAMLRDCFGGRAFTWIICCLNTDIKYLEESLKVLQLCWCCRGIKNYVTINGYPDDNTTIINDKNPSSRAPDEIFGLQFAAQQWVKLVANAEGLFHKLLQSNMLSEMEATEINEWLFLKAECDDCLNANNEALNTNTDMVDNELSENKQTLPRISEDTEPSELSDILSDSDTSIEHDQFLLNDKLNKYIEYFEEKTDELILDRCEEYLNYGDADADNQSVSSHVSESSIVGGRRKTIRPGESLSESELELLRRAAANAVSPESQKIIIESRKTCQDAESKLVQRELLKIIDSPVPSDNSKKYKALLQKYDLKQSLINKLSKEIMDAENQLKELTSLCVAKEQLIDDLTKIIKRQGNMKKWTDKHGNLKQECDKANTDLIMAQAKYRIGNGDSKLSQQVRKSKSIVDHYERRVQDLENNKKIEYGGTKDIKKHELKLKLYRKQIEQVKKRIKRDEKRKNTLELELVKDKVKLDETYDRIIKGYQSKENDKKESAIKQVSARITQLDNILKEKTGGLETCELSEDKELMLRTEIKNLRRTKESLINKRCSLGHKRKIHKSLSDSEERKLLECEEAIEAIDTAIEYKNALICGRGQTKDIIGLGQQRERGEEMLMARLSKLSDVEMRTLLYKYFQKVIDLRSTCAALEATTVASQREATSWRKRCADAWTTLHHTRIMHHRRTTTLTARHYHTLNQLMREMNGESDMETMYSGANGRVPIPLSLEYHQHNAHTLSDSEAENGFIAQHRIAATTAKIKLKDNTVGPPGANFLNEIQQFAHYQQSSIPSQNLKQLQPSSCPPLTRVTRQKNKLVIVQEEKPNL